jgi:hypothetical protein
MCKFISVISNNLYFNPTRFAIITMYCENSPMQSYCMERTIEIITVVKIKPIQINEQDFLYGKGIATTLCCHHYTHPHSILEVHSQRP